MRAKLLFAATLVLAACSPGDEAESGEDFAARVGAGGSQDGGAVSGEKGPTPQATDAVDAPPAGTKVTQLERLGTINPANLGPVATRCTFYSDDGNELLIGGGSADPGKGGRAIVKMGGTHVVLSSNTGGQAALRAGTTLSAEGVTASLKPAGQGKVRDATLTVSGNGTSQEYEGRWDCP